VVGLALRALDQPAEQASDEGADEGTDSGPAEVILHRRNLGRERRNAPEKGNVDERQERGLLRDVAKWIERLWRALVGEPGRCCMCGKASEARYCEACLNEW
jgi:hypothetical protein